uniref:Mucin 2, oligomeric mucus/gel-forming n=1 Tax=Anabas testudineus TaxID=64144 RepID=A0A7N6BRC0_ANATE
TTTTQSTTTTTESTTTTTEPTTTTTPSTPTPTTTTTTQSTTTTTEPTTTTTPSTPTPTTTTTTQSTTTTTESTTTTTEPTTTTTPTTPTPTTTTTTQSTATTTEPTTTTTEPTTTTTQSTTTPTTTTTTQSTTTTTEPTTTTTQSTTTPTTTTTTQSTTTTTEPTTTTTEPTTTTTEPTTTTTQSTTTPTTTTTTPTTTTTTQSTTTPTPTTTTSPTTTTQSTTKCLENFTIEIIPYECPPLENITCTNGKKPVLVYDEYHCCQHYACDCVCEGWGDPHYITFDGFYYSYQGNCTYVLMEEKSLKHNLKIYIDNVYCDPIEDVSCPRSIIISYKQEVVKLINHNLLGTAQLEALKNGESLKLPYSDFNIKILSTGINLVLEILQLKTIITFGITGFSVTLPFEYFGGNTQGHCGTCNNNQADDCMLPGGQLVESCAVMADYWLTKDIIQPHCQIPPVPPTQTPEPPPTFAPCKPNSICDLLKSSLFEACHPFVSPDNFYRGCVFDSCHVSNPTVECTSLQTYAAACAQAGVCVHWRNHTKLCTTDCPSNKVYKPCGPADQPTCEDKPNEPTLNFTTEGCFCPDGMKLFNKESGICVDKCGCLDPEGIPREFNERFEYKCQSCICEESTKTVTCQPKECPAPPIVTCSNPGFVLVNQTNPSDPCCSNYVCECRISTCPVIDLKCQAGYLPVVSVPDGKCCPERTCEPKRVCVHKDTEYEPGSSVPANMCQDCTCSNEVDPKSGLFKVICEFQQCEENCDVGYKYVESDSGECCGKCVQTYCVLNLNGTKQVLVVSWLMTLSLFLDETYSNKNKLIKFTQKECQTNEEVEIPYCEGSCNTFTKYDSSMKHFCSCCKEVRFSNRTVDLHCLNGDVVPYTYIHVEECGCGQTYCTRDAGQSARRRRSFTLV